MIPHKIASRGEENAWQSGTRHFFCCCSDKGLTQVTFEFKVGTFFFCFYRYSIFFLFFSVKFLTLLVKKVLIGFGQTGDHKTPGTSWISTCIKILKEIYKGLGDLNIWPERLGFWENFYFEQAV